MKQAQAALVFVVPRAPSFVAIDGLTNAMIHVASLNEETVVVIADAMRNQFIEHCAKARALASRATGAGVDLAALPRP